jgi:hypothetical protein
MYVAENEFFTLVHFQLGLRQTLLQILGVKKCKYRKKADR